MVSEAGEQVQMSLTHIPCCYEFITPIHNPRLFIFFKKMMMMTVGMHSLVPRKMKVWKINVFSHFFLLPKIEMLDNWGKVINTEKRKI